MSYIMGEKKTFQKYISHPIFFMFIFAHVKNSFKYQMWASLVVQLVKSLPAMWETWVQSLGLEDALEEGMATHSSFLAWRIPRTEEPGGLQSMGSQRVGHVWVTKHSTHVCVGMSISSRKEFRIEGFLSCIKSRLKPEEWECWGHGDDESNVSGLLELALTGPFQGPCSSCLSFLECLSLG